MPRGFRVCRYTDDTAAEWGLLVDADSAADGARGWVEIGPAVLPYAPRGLSPRIVAGVDENGARRTTRVASVTADLWTGVVTQWQLEGSDGIPHTIVATERLGERRSGPTTPIP